MKKLVTYSKLMVGIMGRGRAEHEYCQGRYNYSHGYYSGLGEFRDIGGIPKVVDSRSWETKWTRSICEWLYQVGIGQRVTSWHSGIVASRTYGHGDLNYSILDSRIKVGGSENGVVFQEIDFFIINVIVVL